MIQHQLIPIRRLQHLALQLHEPPRPHDASEHGLHVRVAEPPRRREVRHAERILRRIACVRWSAIAPVMLLAAPLLAQQTAASDAITVTATRTETRLSDTPASVVILDKQA